MSVDRENYAYEFHQKHGFEDYSSTGKSATMIKKVIK